MEHNLTNEKITKRFKSKFDLVNYAIEVAVNMIETGRDPRVKIDVQNRALQTIAEITEGKDFIQEIRIEPERSHMSTLDLNSAAQQKVNMTESVAL